MFDDKPDYFTNSDTAHGEAPRQSIDFTTAEPTPVRQRRGRMRRFFGRLVAIAVVALIAAVWLRYFNHNLEAFTTGYVTSVERRGTLFKTYEGEMITQYALTDTAHVYQVNFKFSIANDSLARELLRYQGTGRPVEVKYRGYRAPVMWRGESKLIVTEIHPE